MKINSRPLPKSANELIALRGAPIRLSGRIGALFAFMSVIA
jgi:hypothetical protein